MERNSDSQTDINTEISSAYRLTERHTFKNAHFLFLDHTQKGFPSKAKNFILLITVLSLLFTYK